jgi:NTP pyrophosphatase (non-canonical NTP hydrolase)
MTFAEYAAARVITDLNSDMAAKHGPTVAPALGLASEAGEVAGKVYKLLRDHDGVLRSDMLEALEKECGDVLWNLDAILTGLGSSLERAAQMNIEKLRLRAERGTLRGNGDER